MGLGVEGRRGGDGVVSREEASVDIDLGVVEELEGDFSELVFFESGTWDVGIDQ